MTPSETSFGINPDEMISLDESIEQDNTFMQRQQPHKKVPLPNP